MAVRSKIWRPLAALVLGTTTGDPALAQKQGGLLKVYFFDSPASMSIHEEFHDRGRGAGDGRLQ